MRRKTIRLKAAPSTVAPKSGAVREGIFAMVGPAVLALILLALCWDPMEEMVLSIVRGDSSPRLACDVQIDGVPAKWGYAQWYAPHKESYVLGGFQFLKQTYGDFRKPVMDRNLNGGPLHISDQTFSRGIGTQAPSKIAFDLKGKYDRFTCKAGLDQYCGPNYGVRFVVIGDGQEMFRSPILHSDSPAFPIDCPVKKVQELVLMVENGQIGDSESLVDWVEPHLSVDSSR